MSARDDILAAVRAGLGHRRVEANLVRRAAADLLADPAATRPALAPGTLTSGTTDIEGSLVLGAHGPRYLHVVVAAEESPGPWA